jgi:release factor glutamine methyltransferase
MRVETALRQGLELLRDGAIGAPALTAELLLAHALHRDRTYLLTHPEHELSELEWLHYGRYLHERLKGQPTQYITRTQEFWGRDFHVEKGVLIPRPETEHVVETALALLLKSDSLAMPAPSQRLQIPSAPLPAATRPTAEGSPETLQQAQWGAGTRVCGAGTPACRVDTRVDVRRDLDTRADAGVRGSGTPACRVDTRADGWRVLDIGAGSGILAVTLALETTARVCATDLSERALRIACANALRLKAPVEFVMCDLGSALAAAAFDLIVSNPPYIATAEIDALQREVREWEPRAALDGGPDGLAVYRRLIPDAARLLRPGGWLILEIGATQAESVSGLLGPGWRECSVTPDLAGLPRVVKAQWSP